MKSTIKRSLIALAISALALGSLTSFKAAVETYNIDAVIGNNVDVLINVEADRKAP